MILSRDSISNNLSSFSSICAILLRSIITYDKFCSIIGDIDGGLVARVREHSLSAVSLSLITVNSKNS